MIENKLFNTVHPIICSGKKCNSLHILSKEHLPRKDLEYRALRRS